MYEIIQLQKGLNVKHKTIWKKKFENLFIKDLF